MSHYHNIAVSAIAKADKAIDIYKFVSKNAEEAKTNYHEAISSYLLARDIYVSADIAYHDAYKVRRPNIDIYRSVCNDTYHKFITAYIAYMQANFEYIATQNTSNIVYSDAIEAEFDACITTFDDHTKTLSREYISRFDN